MKILTITEAVVQRTRSLLKETGISLYRLSENAGIQHGTMSHIMRFTNPSVNLATVIKIASGFNMTVSEFLNDPLFDEDNLKL